MVKTISIPDLHEASKSLSDRDLILDVRTPQEFAAGHIPRAKNIPVDQVANHAKELMQYSTIYLYCRSGGRVVVSQKILAALGVKNLICVDEGGFPDWATAGYPTSKK